MKTVSSRRAAFESGAALCALGLASVVLFSLVRPATGADLRNAVRRVLPATVAVEWQATDRDDPPPAGPASTLEGLPKADESAAATRVPAGSEGATLWFHPETGKLMTYTMGGSEGATLWFHPESGSLHALPAGSEGTAAATAMALAPFLDAAQKPDAVSLASGTVVSSDGLIVTAAGETGEGDYSVTFHDRSKVPAKLVVDDRRSGLQLLKVDRVKTPYVEPADEQAELGQQVMAVLCTDPNDRIVAQGIVAAKDQRIPGLPCEVFQTDVRVGKMSAGAPVADVDGRLVGIVAAMKAPTDSEEGRAYVVPAEYVRLLLEAREEEKTVVVDRPVLGIHIDRSAEGDRPTVKAVVADSAAARAGIRAGDEIIAIDAEEVSTPNDVVGRIGRHRTGDQVTVTIRRDGKQEELRATLGRPEPPPKATTSSSPKIEALWPGAVRIYGIHPGSKKPLRIVRDGGRTTLVDPNRTGEQAIQRAIEFLSRSQKGRANFVFPNTPPAPAVIRVQRSDVEKKLDQFNRDVQSLQQQIMKLTEEVQKLRDGLQDKPTPEK
jgi:S1-C subfamily serine protease